jgi:hypothetical protein
LLKLLAGQSQFAGLTGVQSTGSVSRFDWIERPDLLTVCFSSRRLSLRFAEITDARESTRRDVPEG